MNIPSYYSVQNTVEGYAKASQVLLVGAVTLSLSSRTWYGKLAGLGLMAGYGLVERSRANYLDRNQLRLPIDLPLSTCIGLRTFLESPRNTGTSFAVQFAVGGLADSLKEVDAPAGLLLRAAADEEPESWSKIRSAHRDLEDALAKHLNNPRKGSL